MMEKSIIAASAAARGKNFKAKNLLRQTINIQYNSIESYRPKFYQNMASVWEVPTEREVPDTFNKKQNLTFRYPHYSKHFSTVLNNKSNLSGFNKSLFSSFSKRHFSSVMSNNNTNSSKIQFYDIFNKRNFSTNLNKENYSLDLTKLNINDHIDTLTTKNTETDLKAKSNSEFNIEEETIEFTEETNWEEKVLKSELPVVVTCYADWCGPCKKLKPIITQFMNDNKNFRFVRLNIDDNEELSEKLNISSIPAVFLIYKGNIVDNFVGLPPQDRLTEFFNNINLLTGLGKEEQTFQNLLIGFDELMKKKDFSQAESMLNEAYSHENWRKKYGYLIKLGIAIVKFNKGELDKVSGSVKDLLEFHKQELKQDHLAAKKAHLLEILSELKAIKDIVENDIEKLVENVKNSPKDLNNKYLLSGKFITLEEYNEAIKELLEIIKIDKNWENKKAHHLLISLFQALGGDHHIVVEGRKQLAKIIY